MGDQAFFQNKDCEYFPCHKVENAEKFNCMFCYCPLYALGDRCGGNFTYTKDGVKDCSACVLPHQCDGYEHISSHINEIVAFAKK